MTREMFNDVPKVTRKLQKLLDDEHKELSGQNANRRAEIQKKLFIQRWVSASPEQQAEILLEIFAQKNHSHPLPIGEILFKCR
jgi:hypothetical protein